MNHTYKLATWNANGLCQHARELESFIIDQGLDVLLISEAHFTDRSYMKVRNFAIYITQHPSGRGHAGTAILIRHNIKHYLLPEYRTDHLQATSVCVEDWNGPLVLSAVYCPPRHNLNKDHFEAFFRTLGNRFIAGGDYNSKHQAWGSRLNTPKGRELYKAIRLNNLEAISTGEPTYWPSDANRMPDVLDFFVAKGISRNYIRVRSSLDMTSDHTPVIATISSSVLKFSKPFRLCNRSTDWSNYKSMVERAIILNAPLRTAANIEHAVEYLNTVIQKSAWQSTPVERQRTDCIDNPAIIKIKIAEKRRLRRIWQYSRSPLDKTLFNRAARELKEMLRNQKNDSFQNYLEDLSPGQETDYSLWKATRRLKQPCQNIPPLRKEDNTWAKSDCEKAALFADDLEKRFQPNDIHGLPAEDEEIHRFLAQPIEHVGPLVTFTPADVKRAIGELHPRKAPGYDFITGEMLRELPRKGRVLLTYIFNAVLRTGYFPCQWKVAKIIVLLKPGKAATEASSYRPISLLPCISKLFEKLFLQKLRPVIENQNLLPDHQFGFRAGHSTEVQVHRLVKVIRNCLEEKKYCSAVFLDVAQAFDRVWHPGLLYKLKHKLPVQLYTVLMSYLSDRLFQVKLRDDVTDLRRIRAGVPQGSVLGPILYSLYTADLPTCNDVLTATFADDTAMLAVDEDPVLATEKLQRNVTLVENWLKKWKVRVNEQKSSHITFTMRRDNCPPVTLNNAQIPQSQDVKYLGLHLDRRLTWKTHIKKKRTQLNLKLKKMYWLLGRQSSLDTENKLLLYKAILLPIWAYGAQLWGSAANSNVEIIQRFQAKALRIIINAPWYVNNEMIHRDCAIKTIREFVKDRSMKHCDKLNMHKSHLAVNLLDNGGDVRRLKRHSVLDLHERFNE